MAHKSNGRVALVTGGTGGIGTAICHRLADAGFKVATNFRSAEKTSAWRKTWKGKGYDFATYEADVTDFDGCRQMIERIERDLGPLAVLVNNAGVTYDTTFRKMTPEQWHTVLNTNLDSLFNVTRHVIQGMTERGFGRVINISSINGQRGQIGQTNYAAAKAGMHGFTMALAQEVARKGVTVNTISPGYIATDMVMAMPEDVRKKIIADIPVGRLGTPDEVAYAVNFLASDEAGFITGASISCNGGHHMM
ncbi:MAG TPA: acetoacetyl-CoA reductase [Gemmatimonadales bacterium]|nr:acetoacetyl-CoA reductase [Gemmatimonadales bacterium]